MKNKDNLKTKIPKQCVTMHIYFIHPRLIISQDSLRKSQHVWIDSFYSDFCVSEPRMKREKLKLWME